MSKQSWLAYKSRYYTDPIWRRKRQTRSRIAELKRSARFHVRRLEEIDKRIKELISTL